MAETKPVQSLLRGVELLRLLASAQHGMRLQDLAQRMGLKVPTVHNLLKTLSVAGLVEKLSTNHYAATLSLVALGDAVRHNRQHSEMEDLMRCMAQQYKQARFVYSKATDTALVVVLRMSPDQPKIIQYPSGLQNALYNSSTGLCFLSFAPMEDVCAMRERFPFDEYATQHWTSAEHLDKHLQQQRKQGYAETLFKKQELYRVSVPVYDSLGQLSGYLGVAIGIQHMGTRRAQRALAADVKAGVAGLHGDLFARVEDGA